MQLIFISKGRGHVGQLRLDSRRFWVAAAACVALLVGAAFAGGLYAAGVLGFSGAQTQLASWQRDLAEQQALVEATREALNKHVDALALRLGHLNAHVVRLDALGSRLTQMAELQDGEFDFSTPPAMGGPESPLSDGASMPVSGLMTALDVLTEQLDNRRQQLSVLEDFLLNRRLQHEVRPEGRPVASGYISSSYGQRTDPFSGQRAFHQGVDFAARAGTDIVAVAAGIVIWSGRRDGYGKLIEVNHGNGYVTRYAHNSENLVAVGDTVRRGQVIGRVGSTGRATGPNLHFEVLHNCRHVNPLTYVR
jgi:murein DD-endopeptidase MepM/ murein hydrolase activator NlpD